MKLSTFALVAICSLAGRIEAEDGPDFSRIESLMREKVEAGVPSIAVAVAQHGRIVWERAVGFSDIERRIEATPRTPYFTASVSKTITATALMQLVDRGRVDLDRPVNQYLRDAKVSSPMWDVSQATIRRVASHTAGLATYDQSGLSTVSAINRYGVIVWRPGKHFDYSNLDYGILGQVVEDQQRMSLAASLHRMVFAPLGMTGCFLDSDTGKPHPARYVAGTPVTRVQTKRSSASGASSVYCSAHDLVRFGMYHLKDHLSSQKNILPDRWIEEMQKPSLPPGGDSQYGLGWWLQEDLHGFRGVLAQGGTNSATAYLQLIPSEDIAIAMLWNTGTPNGAAMIDQILAAVLPKYKENLEDTPAARPAPLPGMTDPPAAIIGKWSGFVETYKGTTPLLLDVMPSGELIAELGSEPEVRRRPARFVPGVVRWTMPGSLGVEGEPFDLAIRVEPNGRDVLAGAARTVPPESAPGRDTPQLYYWVQLERK